MFKKLSLLTLALSIALILTACPFDSGGGSNNKHVERDFYIEDYRIHGVFFWCYYGLDQPYSTNGVPADAEAFDQTKIVTNPEIDLPEQEENKVYILQPGRGYVLEVDYFNDQDNTEWIAFEIFVDDKRHSSKGEQVYKKGKKVPKDEFEKGEGTASIVLFRSVPWQFEGKDVQIDVWLEDENGVKSEVFTFDVAVIQLWYPPDGGSGSN